MKSEELNGKTAIVTGASRGIGAATARELAQLGVNVVLAARSKSDINTLAESIRTDGHQALALTCDVADYAAVESCVSATIEHFGALDILVNNAGVIDPIGLMADVDAAAWGQVVDINFKGVYHGIRAALPVMLKQQAGTVINISSGAATNAIEGWAHYCATKAGVLMLTRCLHTEYGNQGIRSLGLSPGTVATDMQVAIRESGINAVSKLDPTVHIKPEWPAKAIAWLCTKDADDMLGGDFSIKTDEGRTRAGLV